jgi:predicted RNA binding protein YcfA (HicA-like mRNA interferase family)
MPRKIRELKAILRKAGFLRRAGKGSHSVWRHPQIDGTIVLSGNDGSDARPYQERQVNDAIREVEDPK